MDFTPGLAALAVSQASPAFLFASPSIFIFSLRLPRSSVCHAVRVSRTSASVNRALPACTSRMPAATSSGLTSAPWDFMLLPMLTPRL